MEAEFIRWLQRPEKTFTENLQFAIKAWKSAEFTLSSKYQVVFQWVAQQDVFIGIEKENLQNTELKEFLQLKCQPGLIAQQVRLEFVQMWLRWAVRWRSRDTRILPELLLQLVEYEIVQDLYRSDYELYAQLLSQLLQSYEEYLHSLKPDVFLPSSEANFFMKIMNILLTSAKKYGDPQSLDEKYNEYILQPLVQILLTLREHELEFFDEFLALEQILCKEYEKSVLIRRIMNQPMHVCLLILECAIVNQRGVENFQKSLMHFILQRLLEEQRHQDAALTLTTAAYALEMFRKHDINLNFKYDDKHTALSYLSLKINEYVEEFREQHLEQVLQLLCSTLRLNPLILENKIFQHTIWMLVANKTTIRQQNLYEEYLVLLMDMIRKLSRVEKFVTNLLNALNTWLLNHKLDNENKVIKGKKKLKEKATDADAPPPKQPKLDDVQNQTISIRAARYLKIIFKEFHASKPPLASRNQLIEIFPGLKNIWPWKSAGDAFSKLIAGLMSKPSLVVWKTLLFNLKTILEIIDAKKEVSDSDGLQLDLISELLCQYFIGSKLSEQSDKYWSEILEQRKLTIDILAHFGRVLLSLPHHRRWMNAFLECSYYASHFQLIVWYYRSDRLVSEATSCVQYAQQIHDFLSDEEWNLLQQRVINFGKASCKFNMNRLLLQRRQAQILFSNKLIPVSLQKILLLPMLSDLEQLQLLLQSSDALWVIRNLCRQEKIIMTRLLASIPSFDYTSCHACWEDLEFFELLCLEMYEQLAIAFSSMTKKSLLGSIEFNDLRAEIDPALDKRVTALAQIINAKLDLHSLKKVPSSKIEEILKIMKQFPIGWCRRQTKSLIFALHLALLRDLKAAQHEELAAMAFDVLNDLLHFGQRFQIIKYFPTQNILQLLPLDTCWEFYEFLYSAMKEYEKSSERFLRELIEILKSAQQEQKLNDNYLKLVMITIESLSALNGPGSKRLKKHLDDILEIYASHINSFFIQTEGRDEKNDKYFVEKTLPGFSAYVKWILDKAKTVGETDSEINEDFRRICKMYIGYSMDYRNTHAVKLITVALNNRQVLHFDQDEIAFVLRGYWQQLNADLKQEQLHEKNSEAVVNLVVTNQTNEEFLLLLKDIRRNIKEEDFSNITKLLNLITKCPFSNVKGAIFNELFKQITLDIIMCLKKDERFQYVDAQVVLNLLACQQAAVDNKLIFISVDTIDDILAFVLDINIKKFLITDTNIKLFITLHSSITDLCSSLIKQRHVLLMDRVPQFTHIFKDLLQSIVWYKSDRQKDTALRNDELDDLAKLAMKLEALMHIIATHSLEVKRVAPFVLTFVINLMVANKRPTTLYPKIKTHIESICYDLVGICDHRVGHFILRSSNEAARQVYELLVKNHKKYHKFKGKV